MTKEEILSYIAAQKEELRGKYGVTKIGLFGSYARGEAHENSDIDIVVELEKPDLFYLIGIKQTVQEAMNINVDIVRLRKEMNQVLKKRIMRDAIYV
ncbi:MAG: nucleotidyltransferase family protein [Ignavibacteriaceae bacterium]